MSIDNSHKVDFIEKLKIRACDLRAGMYVCELDRPWLETPFLLQGFEITNDADIEAIMRYCQHVYIDMQRTRIVKTKFDDSSAHGRLNKENTPFEKKDLEASTAARKQTTNLIKSFADEIRFGQCPKFHLAKATVSDCVAGVMTNPTAMLLMTRLRDKDEYTSQHAFSVCVYSIILGKFLGYNATQLENLGSCGLLHDMGKLEIPDHILNKPGKLNAEEIELMKSHTTLGRDILMSGRDIFSGTVDVAYGHHENLDGTGYPRGLQGHQLNMNCKIVAVVDRYDALTSHRSYRAGHDHLSAVAILNQQAKDNKIDGQLAAGLISHLGVYPPGTIVELSSGEVGIVIGSSPEHLLRPQLLLVRDSAKNPIQCLTDMSERSADETGRPYRIVSMRSPGYLGIDINQYYDLIAQVVN